MKKAMIADAGVADAIVPRPYRIKRVRRETHDTFTLELMSDNSSGGFSFEAGQFNMLYLFGGGEVPISISGDPAHPTPLIHTIRAVGAVTSAMCQLKRGDTIGVRGPYGTHWPVEDVVGSDVLIVAGGIGLAPLRPAIHRLLSQRKRYGRVALLYGARTPQDLLYSRALEQWRGRFDLDVDVTVDSAPRGWRGNVGVVTRLISRARFDPEHSVAMVCGPEVMMRFTILELQKHGVGWDNIYVSMERNMKCAIGFCGHCQFGPTFICKDGPVFRYDRIRPFFEIREI